MCTKTNEMRTGHSQPTDRKKIQKEKAEKKKKLVNNLRDSLRL